MKRLENLTLSYFKVYDEATIIKIAWCQHKGRHITHGIRTESRPHTMTIDFQLNANVIQ